MSQEPGEGPAAVVNEFRFVDTAFNGAENRNRVLSMTDVTARLASLNGTKDCYVTALRFPEAFAEHVRRTGSVRNYCGTASAPFLWFDFDSEKDVAAALVDTRAFTQRLSSLYDVPLEAVRGHFTGFKGFAVEIPAHCRRSVS
jgi:hypothetical protein